MAREKHIMTLHLTHGYFWASLFFLFGKIFFSIRRSRHFIIDSFFFLFRVNWQVSKRSGGRSCAEDSLKSFNNILRRRERSIYFHSQIIDILKILFSIHSSCRCRCCLPDFYIWLFDEMPKWISIIFCSLCPLSFPFPPLIYAFRRQLCLSHSPNVSREFSCLSQ